MDTSPARCRQLVEGLHHTGLGTLTSDRAKSTYLTPHLYCDTILAGAKMKDYKGGHRRVAVRCAECGGTAWVRRHLLGKQEYFYCSRSCAGKAGYRAALKIGKFRVDYLKTNGFREAQSARLKAYYAKHPEKVTRLYGEDNPNWRHGEARRGYTNFTETRKQTVREHDNHTCQICGKKWSGIGPRFDVHHIDGGRDNFQIDNLVTLCKSCHTKLHRGSLTLKR